MLLAKSDNNLMQMTAKNKSTSYRFMCKYLYFWENPFGMSSCLRIMELITSTDKTEILECRNTGYFLTHFEVLFYCRCVFALKCTKIKLLPES